MGNYQRTYDKINELKVALCLIDAEASELDVKYYKAKAEMVKGRYHGDFEGVMFNDVLCFTYDELKDAYEDLSYNIGERRAEIKICIGECEGYIRELEYMDGVDDEW